MYAGRVLGDNERVGSSRAAQLVGVYVGVAVLAEAASIAVGWGSTPAYQSILFALYTLTIVLIGGLIAVRHPDNAIGWILAGIGTFNAVFGDFISTYGHRASTQGWPAGPLAEWIGYGSWQPAVLMWILALLLVPTGRLPGHDGGSSPTPAAPALRCTSPGTCLIPETAATMSPEPTRTPCPAQSGTSWLPSAAF